MPVSSRWLALLALLLLMGGCSRPDVVFITIDTLRVDHVGAFSPNSPAKTPHIDALAADGVAYTQAYSPISVTGPAFCTLHTGQDPGTHGVVMNLFRGGATLGPEATTLAEVLKDEGFRTGAFVSGFTLRHELGLGQGFERYATPKNRRRPGDLTVDRMFTWMQNRVRRWDRMFAWYHTYDPHGPLRRWEERPPAHRWKSDRDDYDRIARYQRLWRISDPDFYARRYATAVEFADAQVGRIVARLKEQGRYEDAIIVLVSDHGESFTERELWFDHGTEAHEEQLHVPLIVKYPDNARAGSRVGALVGLKDIAPTVFDVLDIDPPAGMDGRSLADPEAAGHPLLTGESSHCKNEGEPTCRPYGPLGKVVAARDAAHTVVVRSTAEGDRLEVYDRRKDPAERHPLPSAEAPAPLATAAEALARHRRAIDYSGYEQGAGGGTMTAEEAAEEEALRELGYIE